MTSFFRSEDAELSAALATAGVPMVDDAGRPVERVKGSRGIKSAIQFARSNAEGIETSALAMAYRDATADKLLDERISQLGLTADVKAELLHLAQLSAMSYLSHGFSNLRRIEKAMGATEFLIEIARPGMGTAIVQAKNRSEATNRKLLARFG